MHEHPTCIDVLVLRILVMLLTGNLDTAHRRAEVTLMLYPHNATKVQHLRDRILSVENTKEKGNRAFALGEWDHAIQEWNHALKVGDTVHDRTASS